MRTDGAPRAYTLAEANDRLPEVAALVGALRDQRLELIRLRDRFEALTGRPFDDTAQRPARTPGEAPGGPVGLDEATTLTGLEENQLIALRVRAIVDQMGASVARLDDWGVALRDISTGLVDFPARDGDAAVWLCWRLGEPQAIAWWHDETSGYAGRRPIAGDEGFATAEQTGDPTGD